MTWIINGVLEQISTVFLIVARLASNAGFLI